MGSFEAAKRAFQAKLTTFYMAMQMKEAELETYLDLYRFCDKVSVQSPGGGGNKTQGKLVGWEMGKCNLRAAEPLSRREAVGNRTPGGSAARDLIPMSCPAAKHESGKSLEKVLFLGCYNSQTHLHPNGHREVLEGTSQRSWELHPSKEKLPFPASGLADGACL